MLGRVLRRHELVRRVAPGWSLPLALGRLPEIRSVGAVRARVAGAMRRPSAAARLACLGRRCGRVDDVPGKTAKQVRLLGAAAVAHQLRSCSLQVALRLRVLLMGVRARPSRRGAGGILLRSVRERVPHRVFNGLRRARWRVSEVSLLQRHEVTLLQALGLAQLLLILGPIALRGRLRAQ